MNPEELAGRIQAVEQGVKRFPSLVVELFFASNVLPSLRLRSDPDARGRTGCLRFRMASGKSSGECWGLIVASGPDEEDRTIASILEKRTRMAVFFFIYDPYGYRNPDEWQDCLRVRAFSDKGLACIPALEERLEGAVPLLRKSGRSTISPDIGRWFEGYGERKLWELLLTRVLMDNVLDGWKPLDLDAIFLTGNRLHVVEFKRKDPTPNGCIGFQRAPASMRDICSLGSEQKKEIVGRSAGKGIGTAVKRIRLPAYGLDMSHLRTVRICKGAGFGYSYLVWKKTVGKGIGFQAHMETLFEKPGCPRRPFRLYAMDIDARSFCGFSHTTTRNHDSGSYHKNNRQGNRIQAMIPERGFSLLFERS